MKLYDIITEIADIEQYLEDYAEANFGECPEDAFTKLFDLESKKDDFLAGFYKSLKNREALSVCLDAEIEKLQAKKKKNEKIMESIESLVTSIIGEGVKYSRGLVIFSWRKSEVLILNEKTEYPETFYRVATSKTLSKTDMKAYIKEGGVIENASILIKQNLQVK